MIIIDKENALILQRSGFKHQNTYGYLTKLILKVEEIQRSGYNSN